MGPLVRQCGVRDHVTVPGSLKTSDGGAGDSPKGRSSKPISGTASISVSTDHFLQSQRVLMYLICTPDQWLAGLLEMQYWRLSFGPSDQVSSSSRTQPLGKGAQVPSHLHVACSVPGLLYPHWGGWAERLADIYQPPSPFWLVVDHLTSSGHSLTDLKCKTQWFNPLCPHILAIIDTSSI